ncbi:FAD/NAD(P)-binding protein [Streptomyces sp. S1A]|uniref:FAD/NAD(P)-binding protein n=1 Tax=Streptomyces sp. ICN903 TaxID=2964654 RepID=UPI001EDA8CB5|nr:FAD/NAD(P)-binding protein [Streptomyces sp. ICN903]MCG3043361.1 FAD/NAD(P)-binding protein [Streptomyces sp. ICN903]
MRTVTRLSNDDPRPLTVAVIGTGPRGLSVLERLAVRLREEPAPRRRLRVYAVDAVEVGAGRVWRTDQQDWFTMNTVVGQVTMYSGEPDGGPARPGAGPSLGQWIAERARTHGEEPLGPNDYASRLRYGQYLRSVYDTIAEHLPGEAELVPVHDRIVRVRPRPEGGYHLEREGDPAPLGVDRLVLATGHPRNEPDDFEREMLGFAAGRPGVHYLCGDSAADLDLDPATIPPGTTVGVLGMGLSFYDVMVALTLGRGGAFTTLPDGSMRYRPSGREPHIVAGSRSGLPIPARGRNQKEPHHSHRALFLTPHAVEQARKRRLAETGSPRLDFDEDVLPLLLRELDHVYWTAHVTAREGKEAGERFAERHASVLLTGGDPAELLREAGLGETPALDLRKLARPFGDRHFRDPRAFRAELLDVMRWDLSEADLGNGEGPLKAALDVLRDIRNVVREAVDYGGLRPSSHQEAFLRRFLPVNALLSAGPPRYRVRQLVALIEAGVVEVAGPATTYTADEEAGGFRVASPRVPGSARIAQVLIDARIPVPHLRRDTSPLVRGLLADGLVSEYVVEDSVHGERFESGGLAVTRAPFHVVDAGGRVRTDLYALGIPTEHTRWFTQVGSSRPGMRTLFYRDADAIAADLLAGGPPQDRPAGRALVGAASGAPAEGGRA